MTIRRRAFELLEFILCDQLRYSGQILISRYSDDREHGVNRIYLH